MNRQIIALIWCRWQNTRTRNLVILKQSFINFEFIISGNASTDLIPAICQAQALEDVGVRFPFKILRRGFGRQLERLRGAGWSSAQPQLSMVFAPHQDDETLGCGGAILKRSRAGTRVVVVFMTDGGGSHRHLLDVDELKKMRIQEALAAGRLLGVAEEDILFLGFPDGCLSQNEEDAARKVSRLLAAYCPEEVYIPYHEEPPPDHHVTNHVVLAALARQNRATTVCEYPIWYWYHWPWIRFWQQDKREMLSVLKNTLAAGFGAGMFTHFKDIAPIDDVEAEKWAALNEHKTQMTRLIPDARWLTLHDVANGEFLNCFFQGYEPFRRYLFPKR